MRTFSAIAVAAAAVLLLLFPNVASKAVSEGLFICATGILPSLFPFFAVSNLITGMGLTNAVSSLLAPLMQRLFHISGSAAPVFIMGMLGGYPSGAQTAASLYKSGEIDQNTAERALVFSNNAGPAFVFGVMGAGVFQSVRIGAVLYVIHLTAAILTGVFLRPKSYLPRQAKSYASTNKPLLSVFPEAVRSAGETTFTVCVFVLFFRIITEFLSNLFPVGSMWSTVFLGSFELAGGANLLMASSSDIRWRFYAASCLLGWGGLCVHSQTAAILHQSNLSCRRHILGKSLQATICLILSIAVAPFLPLPVACISISPLVPFLLQIAILLLLCVWLCCILKITSGKVFANRL